MIKCHILRLTLSHQIWLQYMVLDYHFDRVSLKVRFDLNSLKMSPQLLIVLRDSLYIKYFILAK